MWGIVLTVYDLFLRYIYPFMDFFLKKLYFFVTLGWKKAISVLDQQHGKTRLKTNLLSGMLMTIDATQYINGRRAVWIDRPLPVPLRGVGNLLFSLKSQNKTPEASFTEAKDIKNSQNGDPDAFRRLVERHQEHVSKLLWRFTRDMNCHEELVQETFVQAYMSLKTYKTQAPFEHWLARIATRVGYRFWKQNSRHTHTSLQETDWQQAFENTSDSIDPQEAAELVHLLLAKLPSRDRLVITLRYLEQCTIEETAQRTGWSQSLVKVQTHRAKQKLKKLLKNTDIEFGMEP